MNCAPSSVIPAKAHMPQLLDDLFRALTLTLSSFQGRMGEGVIPVIPALLRKGNPCSDNPSQAGRVENPRLRLPVV